jgi:hypothetical protein
MKNFSKQVFDTELREHVCFRVQPRRIAALALSRRVADQLHVHLGTSVGYRIGQGDHLEGLCDRQCPVLVCRGRYGLGGVVLLFILGSNLGGVGPGGRKKGVV